MWQPKSLILRILMISCVLKQVAAVASASDNHDLCDVCAHGEAACNTLSLLQTHSVKHSGNHQRRHHNKVDDDHDENHDPTNRTMLSRGKAHTSEPIALQFSSSQGNTYSSGWRLGPENHKIQGKPETVPGSCTSSSDWKKLSYRANGCKRAFPRTPEQTVPANVAGKLRVYCSTGLGGRWTVSSLSCWAEVSSLDEAKQMCQSMSDCKAFWFCKKRCSKKGEVAYFYRAVGPLQKASPGYEGALYFEDPNQVDGDNNDNNNNDDDDDDNNSDSNGSDNNNNNKSNNNDNDNDDNNNNNINFGPDLGRQGRVAMQDLKKASELIEKELDDVATKDDLKLAVNKIEETFEEQLQEAGKHIIENRKLTKRIGDILESIIKSKTSTARRRRRK